MHQLLWRIISWFNRIPGVSRVFYSILHWGVEPRRNLVCRSRGNILTRTSQGYEAARIASARNLMVPNNFPALIVQANNSKDVVYGVLKAKELSLKISICSGGSSFSVNHMRDGCLLIDVSRLDSISVNKECMTFTAGPGTKGNILAEHLMTYGLSFPGGHCTGVCLGGYLLQGSR